MKAHYTVVLAAGVAAVAFGIVTLVHPHGTPPGDSPKPAAAEEVEPKTPRISFLQQLAPCPDEANKAVLHKLVPVLDEPYNPNEQWLNEQDARIACIREWAKSLKDPCVRSAYCDWLDHYANSSKRMREDVRSDRAASDQAKYDQERREERRRVQEYEQGHPVPVPPHCDIDTIRRIK